MATEVLHSFNDFVLFPQRDDVYVNFQEPFPEAGINQFCSGMSPGFPQDFPTMSNYYGSEPAVSSTDFSLYEPSTASISTSGPQSNSPSVAQSNDQVSSNYSHTSGASAQSTASSAVGSPYSQANHGTPAGQDHWIEAGLGIAGGLAPADFFPTAPYHMPTSEPDAVNFDERYAGSFVDPHLLSSFDRPAPIHAPASPYTGFLPTAFPNPSHLIQPPSPAPSDLSSHDSHRGSIMSRSRHASPYLYNPYPSQARSGRRNSFASRGSQHSYDSPRSISMGFEDDGKDQRRCPQPDCGRIVKDLKAHMLTHQSERPEKCPIVTCEYHTKGFARKYDRCRHTLTHYKGTMVCDFCPNSGSAAEKSFNRADVFKRHLTSVHSVEQSPPNSRKKAPSVKKAATQGEEKVGKCSTCSSTFSNAQEFYDHLDDCVLKFLDRGEPSEDINEQHLKKINNDKAVKETMERHMLPIEIPKTTQTKYDPEEGDEDEEEEDETDATWTGNGSSNSRSGKGSIKTNKDSS